MARAIWPYWAGGVGAEMERIGLEQVVLQRGIADVVEVGLARLGVGLQGLDDVFLALIERLLTGLADIEPDEHFIAAGVRAWMVAFFRPARSSSARMASTLGFWVNLTSTTVPPRKSMPSGMWCQNSMEAMPAREKISEKARKYHFLLRKSILVLRNSSTVEAFYPRSAGSSKFLVASQTRLKHLTSELAAAACSESAGEPPPN